MVSSRRWLTGAHERPTLSVSKAVVVLVSAVSMCSQKLKVTFVVAAGMGILILGYFALQYTRYGIWLRAVAQNRPMAAALGVPVPRVFIERASGSVSDTCPSGAALS